MFQNAHKLFGVSKILNILKNLDPSQKPEAMRSIIYQSFIRDRYPVHGCVGVMNHLKYQIWQAEEELQAVYQQLEMYRQHEHQQQQHQHQMPEEMPSQLELGMAPPSNATSGTPSVYNIGVGDTNNNLGMVHHQHQYSSNGNVDASVGCSSMGYVDTKEEIGNPNLWVSGSNGMIQSQAQGTVQQQEMVQDYDEIRQFFHTIDDRQSYIDSKEPYDTRYVNYYSFYMLCLLRSKGSIYIHQFSSPYT